MVPDTCQIHARHMTGSIFTYEVVKFIVAVPPKEKPKRVGGQKNKKVDYQHDEN